MFLKLIVRVVVLEIVFVSMIRLMNILFIAQNKTKNY